MENPIRYFNALLNPDIEPAWDNHYLLKTLTN